jgi:hypothetical protein
MLNWKTSKEDLDLISKIADRFLSAPEIRCYSRANKIDVIRDIEAAHNNGCPIELYRLANAEGLDFFHDVIGIINNINRETGKLDNCFLPRFAVTQ